MHSRVFPSLGSLLLLVLPALVPAAGARAETIEIEPNHPCASAQSLGSAGAAPSVRGQRDAGDVDYYRVAVTAGELLTIDLLGAGAGDGTLYDGYLGVFTGDCQGLIATDDQGGAFSDARVQVLVQATGSVVIAATAWPDYSFTGDGYGTGTYRLRVNPESVTGTLSGRLVDAETGRPVSGYLYLYRCDQGACSDYLLSGYSDSSGRFAFHSAPYTLLTSGQYLLSVDAYLYEPRDIGPFEVNGKTDVDVGDLAITPVPTGGSIRGRLVDEATGQPLRGNGSPYAYAELLFCGSGGDSYCYYRGYQYAGADGAFHFTGTQYNPLLAGSYRIRTAADQYVQTEGDPFTVGDDEDVDVGDVGVRSLPVRVEPVETCSTIPYAGGRCRFTVKVINGQTSVLRARAWAVVTGSDLAPPVWSSTFQLPQKSIFLLPGGSTVLPFAFDVPGEVNSGAYVCARLYASPEDKPLLPLAGRDLFCLYKSYGTIQQVPEAELRRLRTTGVLPNDTPGAAPTRQQPPARPIPRP
jgi:hypothetical protein